MCFAVIRLHVRSQTHNKTRSGLPDLDGSVIQMHLLGVLGGRKQADRLHIMLALCTDRMFQCLKKEQ